ncbi:hypothetical protein BTA51_03280 [Hahella sp. CCB-MM4]|nr:hypothetical protein BTA51_03280 [Hahella sp. CCB-MM4]
MEKFPAGCPSWLFTLLVSAYLLIAFNGSFFTTVDKLHGMSGIESLTFMVSIFIFFWVLFNLILTLVAVPYVLKPITIFILLASSIATYFMHAYNIMIDKSMIQNLMETDLQESQELLNLSVVFYVLFKGLLPAVLVWMVPIRYGSILQQGLIKTATALITVLIIGVVAMFFYQDYASLFRNHRYIRNLIVPVNYMYSLESYAKQFLPKSDMAFKQLATDARLGSAWNNVSDRKVVAVLVVGETARSANFSLNGYQRETTPALEAEDIVSFTNFSSCGTSTAVSVPCMFSIKGRSDFENSEERYTENLLDALKHAGFRVLWRDNNSGCKGVCDRVEFESTSRHPAPSLCEDGECFDMALLDSLEQEIDASDKNTVIVLHQKGSHGPAYFLRVPKEFQKYQPQCHTNQLQECSRGEITNAYDNTILYTDHFLSEVIQFLKQRSNKYDASMIYVSDHGESLGEHNLYLHGIPYMLAPEEQTHVPFILWMADGFTSRFAIDKECLINKRQDHFSQDNLFDSVLGMLDVETGIYRNDRDIFNGCRAPSNTVIAQQSASSAPQQKAPSTTQEKL